MSDNYYPELDPGMLLPVKIAFGSIMADPLWLDRRDCPYDADTRDALTKMIAMLRPKDKREVREVVQEQTDFDLEEELVFLLGELRRHGRNLDMPDEDGKGGDGKEIMAVLRTNTALLEKITSLRERAANIKTVAEFTTKVMTVFESILTPEQRTRAMEKLEQN